jgi:5-(carboxyamino)imidazole ribonucleotide synthase
MSAMAAYRLGLDVAILEKEKDSPAGQLTQHEFVGSVDQTALLRRFAQACDVITLENEFVDFRRLEFLELMGKPVVPGSSVIGLIQDKLLQKEVLARHHLPVAEFADIASPSGLGEVAGRLGYPVVLKSRKMGYDGYGNATVRSLPELRSSYQALTKRHSRVMAEKFVSFRMELAVMVVRTRRQTSVYPVVQTIQKGHICHIVIAPAPISPRLRREAEEIAIEAVRSVGGMGLFAIELFLTPDDTILVNEMAPRPHNSGHYTIEGCVTSQFENHIRSVLQLPLGSTAMVRRHAVMVNLLGSGRPAALGANHQKALKSPAMHLHIYGKRVSRKGRKMGHVTLVGDNLKNVFAEATTIASRIRL